MPKKRIIVAVDFDGTLADHCFPEIGEEVPLAFEFLKKLKRAGATLILWTMRSDHIGTERSPEGHAPDRKYLTEALDWCRGRGVEFDAANRNPWQASWTDSPKAYAHVYIDDAALGCPLHPPMRIGGRPVVDWSLAGPMALEVVRAMRSVG